ncbi:MAG: glycosyltransferase [Anaerolineae bacterium]|nr:glycosyltransferase [Anaerolineae bacterium]
MKLSFIILTYKRGELLKKCLESIIMQQGLPQPYEILIVDNGGDVSVSESANPDIHIRVITPPENIGPVAGHNLGMKHAQGQYWIFIDDDEWWHDADDAARLVHFLDTHPTCGAVAFKTIDLDGHVIPGELPHPDKPYILACRDPVEVPYFYEGVCALRAEAVQQVGDYPERYYYGMEGPDLALRMMDAGYRVYYEPDSAVYHARSPQGRTAGAKYWHNMTLNKSRMAWRLLPLPYPLTTLFIWSAKTLLETHRPAPVWAAWRNLWRERRLLAAERKPIKPETVRYLRQIGARLLY